MAIKKTKTLVLALGESTNTHRLQSTEEIEYEEGVDEAIRFLLKGTGVVLHEEHDRVCLCRGIYYKTNQREFNPFDGSESIVWD
jgi:hypothetical protein